MAILLKQREQDERQALERQLNGFKPAAVPTNDGLPAQKHVGKMKAAAVIPEMGLMKDTDVFTPAKTLPQKRELQE